MLQHRHNFPGYTGTGPNETWWHDVNMKHVKYPTAHDQPILGTREFTPGARKGKAVTPQYSYNEYGEEVITTTPTEGELFAKAVEQAEAEALAALMDAAETPKAKATK